MKAAVSLIAWLDLLFSTLPPSSPSVLSQMSQEETYHRHTGTRSCWIALEPGVSCRQASCRWLYAVAYKQGSDASHHGTPGEEEHLIRACEQTLALGALEVLVGWPSFWVLPSSGWVLPSSGSVQHSPLPAVVLVVPPVPLPLPDQSLAQDQVTSQVEKQLGRPDELAALEVQLLMLAARRGTDGALLPPHVPPHSQPQPGELVIELSVAGVASLWLGQRKPPEVLEGSRPSLVVSFFLLYSASCTPGEVC